MLVQVETVEDVLVLTLAEDIDAVHVEAFTQECLKNVAEKDARRVLIDASHLETLGEATQRLLFRLYALRFRHKYYRFAVCGLKEDLRKAYQARRKDIPVFTDRAEAAVELAAPEFIVIPDPSLPVWKRKRPGWRTDMPATFS